MPLQFEQHFVRQGFDPDTVGRFLPTDVHGKIHSGKGIDPGGIFNYQWKRFFEHAGKPGVAIDPNLIDPSDWRHFNPNDPVNSITGFVEKLREIGDEAIKKVSGNDIINELEWPFKP